MHLTVSDFLRQKGNCENNLFNETFALIFFTQKLSQNFVILSNSLSYVNWSFKVNDKVEETSKV